MRNTSKIRKVKNANKQAERRAQASTVKQNRAQKQANTALKASRVAVEAVKRQESAAEQLTKLQKQAAKVKRQAMYAKPGFVTLTKKEIAELSETDRATYMAQKSKEDRKNDNKSEVAKARRATPRKRTVRRELERATAKAQKIVDKAAGKPVEKKVVAANPTITVTETKKHSHTREIARRTRQAAKAAAKKNQ